MIDLCLNHEHENTCYIIQSIVTSNLTNSKKPTVDSIVDFLKI